MKEISEIIKNKISFKKDTSFEKKNFALSNSYYDNYINYLSSLDYSNPSGISRSTPYIFYGTCSYLATAIDKIANECATISPILVDVKTKEKIFDSEFLNDLKQPNGEELWNGFVRLFASHYLISGNCFIRLNGNINNPPKEMFIVDTRLVSSTMGKDGSIQEYIETFPNRNSFTYKKKSQVVGGRYINRYVTADNDFELIHVKDVNIFPASVFTIQSYGWGRSKVSAIFNEIEQIEKANIFNRSVLERGAKPGLVIKSKPKVQDEEEFFKSNILNRGTGPENAGNTMYIDDTVDIQDFSKTPRDMDYQSLIDEVKKVIYQRYNIPLPLVSDRIMTYNNLETSVYMLYDSAVLPVINVLFEALTTKVLHRYSEYRADLEVTYEAKEIEAIESRLIEKVKGLNEMEVLTKNEIRSELGYDVVDENDNQFSDEMKKFIYSRRKNDKIIKKISR